ncbi:28S ribosomal protein S9, mitochondrial-like isoform X4 [Poeciliopsis prolifica]|uniref:28S ribosomal protein S9, mitochondrial-like isoform X4 n=1 Tax=Poeciliopsis prolifica TaxID=188132 RepID=UPI0024145D59|nr:28S ribosomal protein S9, mitochondrial-like isoform X4 [Poeciliopsis prolifica]
MERQLAYRVQKIVRRGDAHQLPPLTRLSSPKMAANCARIVGSFLGKSVNFASSTRPVTLQVCRQICGTPTVRRKNLGTAGPEKFTPEFIQKQVEEFELGKRHLANMMGEDPENFTQEDIDRSIAYLFPSGLFEKSARPIMKDPVEIFPKQRAVQWGPDGRPFHFLFYTGKPSYYSLMHDLYSKVLKVEKHQDQLRAKGLFPTEAKKIALGTSRWLTKEELEAVLVETISSQDYDHYIQLMERLVAMPCSNLEQQFVMSHRQQLEAQSMHQAVPPLQKDDAGVDFSTAEGRRKSSRASVVLRDCGAGRITVNGQDYVHYFPVLQDREQLMFPLQFCGLLGRFDLDCSVSGGGRSGQTGALRLAISRALLSFVSQSEGEAMRQAGLLTPDPRVRERKKPGQEGARRKFTWKKR